MCGRRFVARIGGGGKRIAAIGLGLRMNATAAKTMKTVIWIANQYVMILFLVRMLVTMIAGLIMKNICIYVKILMLV